MPNLCPPKIVIGFQKRENAMDGNLAFITYRKPDGTIFNEARFKKWLDGSIEIIEADNNPRSGFVLGQSVIHGNSFSGNIYNIRLFQVHNEVEFEVPIEDFLALTTYTNVNRRYVEGDCVFYWENTRLHIISVDDPEYVKIKEYSQQVYSSEVVKKTHYEVGDTFIIRKHEKKSLIGKEITYIGEHDVSEYIKNKKIKAENIICNDEGKFSFSFPEIKQHLFVECSQYDSQREQINFEIMMFDNIGNDEISFFQDRSENGNKTMGMYSEIIATAESKELINSGVIIYHHNNNHFPNFKFDNLPQVLPYLKRIQEAIQAMKNKSLIKLKSISLELIASEMYSDKKTIKFIQTDGTLCKVDIQGRYNNRVFTFSEGFMDNGKIKYKANPAKKVSHTINVFSVNEQTTF